MAFQLDHNIFFQGLNAQQNKQNSMFDMLMQGVQAGQNARALDIKRRQMENGGDLPAPIQIVNDYEKAIREGNYDRANNLAIFAKAFDKGIVPYAQGGSAFDMLTGQPSAQPASFYDKLIPPMNPSDLGETPPASAPAIPLSVNDLQSTGDPDMDANRAKMFEQSLAMQGTEGGNPLRVTVRPQRAAGVGLMPGYAESLGSKEAVVKGMGRQAEKDVDNRMNPLIAGGEAQAKADVEAAMAAEIARETGRGKAEAEATASEEKKALGAQNSLNIMKLARNQLPNATGSGAGSLMNRGKEFVGKSDDSTKANKQLKLYSGWLVSNVPRMEGPQSDFDVMNYKSMAADVGNEALPIEDRLAALDGLEQIYKKYEQPGQQGAVSDEEFNAVDATPLPNAASEAPKMGDEVDGYVFLGGNPADPKRWKQAR